MADRPPPSKFTERLSLFMVIIASIGAFWVLSDPKVTLVLGASWFSFPGGNFSSDLKGAVIFAILIGGWVAVKEYWLGNSDSGKQQQESISRIAEQSAPAQAAAVAAAVAAPLPAAPAPAPMPAVAAEAPANEGK